MIQKPRDSSNSRRLKDKDSSLKDEDPTEDMTDMDITVVDLNSSRCRLSSSLSTFSPINNNNNTLSPANNNKNTFDADRRKAMDMIAESGRSGYAQILLYNSFRETGTAARGIDLFTDIHSNLMFLHGFMAGFQFLALDSDSIDTTRANETTMSRILFFIRVVGLSMSFTGVVVSLMTIEYLKSIINEPYEMQVRGVMSNAYFFKFSDQLSTGAVYLIITTVNIKCYGMLPDVICYLFNIISALCGIYVGYKFKKMIVDRQKGRYLYSDPIFVSSVKNKSMGFYHFLMSWLPMALSLLLVLAPDYGF